jgi:hypothetical protein
MRKDYYDRQVNPGSKAEFKKLEVCRAHTRNKLSHKLRGLYAREFIVERLSAMM